MDRSTCEILFQKYDFTHYQWIDPQCIHVAQWVRIKCMFGCNEYGKNASCPPNVPIVSECERFFKEYTAAVIFHFQKTVEKPEDRFPWTRGVNLKLLELEREIFISGHPKAFLLFMDSCCICKRCTGERNQCKHPVKARPTPEAMGVDVFATVKEIGYPIEVLSDYTKAMNRYAFLLIE